ncbi:MAG: hypothetical protein KDA53_01625 [Hyphomonas sp.]|nr:hypothetical protein [Hyphomonas sp.]
MLAEDLFGLNIRGVKSVYTLWVRPRRYFEAAQTPDWGGKFTPSIRLWLSFFAIFAALKFWWLGSSDGMTGAYAAGFAQAGLQLPAGMTYEEVGAEAVLLVFGMVPFLQMFAMLLLALFYPFWGRPMTLTLRQRYLFGVILPSTSLMPILMTIMIFVPQNMMTLYGVGLALVTFLIDLQAGYRGGFAHRNGAQRFWRAGLLAFVVVVLNTLTSVGAQIAGIIYINQKYAFVPPG